MQLIDDHESAIRQVRDVAFLRQQHGETLRSRDEKVSRLAAKLRSLARARVAGAQSEPCSSFSNPIPAIGARRFFSMS